MTARKPYAKAGNKTNREGNPQKSMPFDRCQTPAYALDPLLPYLKPGWVIWEPAAGEGNLARALRGLGFVVVASDLLIEDIGDDVEGGRNLFHWQPQHFDAIVTNPPYSVKFDVYRRCYELGRPFALLLPVEALGVGAAQRLYKKHGHEQLLLDKRINFKMPQRGWQSGEWKSTAWFPTFWSCWQMLSEPVLYGSVVRRHDDQLAMGLEAA